MLRSEQAYRETVISSRVLHFLGIFLVMLHTWAAFYPSHLNWGVHFFSFYAPVTGVITFAMGTLVVIPRIGEWIMYVLERIVKKLGKFPPILLLIATVGAFLVLAASFTARAHLLGDSMLILQLTPESPEIRDTSSNFRNQPFTYYAVTLVQRILGGGGPVETLAVYQTIGYVTGIVSIGLIFWLLTELKTGSVEKVLLGVFLIANSRIQFFFGYVENYSLLSIAITAYFILGWMALEYRVKPIIPMLCFPVMVGLHISAIVFLPTLFILFYREWKDHRLSTMIFTGLLLIAGITIFTLSNYSLGQFVQRISDAVQYDFLRFYAPPGVIPYGVFSFLHLVDWGNAIGHIAPFAFVGSIALLPIALRYGGEKHDTLYFLAAGSITGIIFTLVLNPALGMARDWDFLACFLIPLRYLAVFLFLPYLHIAKEGKRILAMAVVLTVLHTAAWVGVNADQEKHLQRAEMLSDPRLSGTFPKIYYENLATTFFQRGEFNRALVWYERYMSVDSSNPRIVGNLSDIYRRLGDRENTFRMLMRTTELGSRNPGIFSNLGAEYAQRGDTTMAVRMFQQALTIDSSYATSHANLSIIFLSQRQYQKSAYHATRAIALGLAAPNILKAGAYAYAFAGEYRKALGLCNQYLGQVPGDAEMRKVRDQIVRYL